jgi:phosphoribosylformylglycinamidine synthase
MAAAAGTGVTLETADIGQLFGEDQARYLIACSFDQAEALMAAASQAGVPIAQVGRFGGDSITFGGDSGFLSDLGILYRTAFEAAVG